MREMSLLELKIRMAQQLGDNIIKIVDYNKFFWGDDVSCSNQEVREFEWLHVMSLVEQSLSEAHKVAYADILMHNLNANLLYRGYYPGDETIELGALCKVAFATFEQRATAVTQLRA